MFAVVARVAATALVVAVMFGSSCASQLPPEDGDEEKVPQAEGNLWSAPSKGLAWLASRQRADGFWGDDAHRMELTSLAILAFLHQNEAPGRGTPYSAQLERGAKALVELINAAEEPTEDEQALAMWALAEIYASVPVPLIGELLKEQLSRFKEMDASPWHGLAVDALIHSRNPDAGRRMLDQLEPPAQTNLASATPARLLIKYLSCKGGVPRMLSIPPGMESDVMSCDGSATSELPTHRLARELDVERAVRKAFRRHLDDPDFAPSNLPAISVYAWNRLAFLLGGDEWRIWSKPFQAELVAAQVVEGERGWWTAGCLGVSKDPQTEGMNETDAAVYTTSLMVMCLDNRRHLPTFRHEEPASYTISDDIEIKIVR
jgi:hypothetical protein